MTKAELNKLKAKQPKGYRAEIAKEASCTPEYVDAVLRGDRSNTTIINLAINKAAAHQKLIKQQQKRIHSL